MERTHFNEEILGGNVWQAISVDDDEYSRFKVTCIDVSHLDSDDGNVLRCCVVLRYVVVVVVDWWMDAWIDGAWTI